MREADNLADEIGAWNLLRDASSVTVAPHSIHRVILGLENAYCAYPEIVTSGGKGSTLRVGWAESLYEEKMKNWMGAWWEDMPKGHRDEIENKLFLAMHYDTFKPDGGAGTKESRRTRHACDRSVLVRGTRSL